MRATRPLRVLELRRREFKAAASSADVRRRWISRRQVSYVIYVGFDL